MDDELRDAERAYRAELDLEQMSESVARRYVSAFLRSGQLTNEMLLSRLVYLEDAVRNMAALQAPNVPLPDPNPSQESIARYLFRLTQPMMGAARDLEETIERCETCQHTRGQHTEPSYTGIYRNFERTVIGRDRLRRACRICSCTLFVFRNQTPPETTPNQD
jgi:hypothetical protein